MDMVRESITRQFYEISGADPKSRFVRQTNKIMKFYYVYFDYPHHYIFMSIILSILSGNRRCDLNLLTAHSAALPFNPLLLTCCCLFVLREDYYRLTV